MKHKLLGTTVRKKATISKEDLPPISEDLKENISEPMQAAQEVEESFEPFFAVNTEAHVILEATRSQEEDWRRRVRNDAATWDQTGKKGESLNAYTAEPVSEQRHHVEKPFERLGRSSPWPCTAVGPIRSTTLRVWVSTSKTESNKSSAKNGKKGRREDMS